GKGDRDDTDDQRRHRRQGKTTDIHRTGLLHLFIHTHLMWKNAFTPLIVTRFPPADSLFPIIHCPGPLPDAAVKQRSPSNPATDHAPTAKREETISRATGPHGGATVSIKTAKPGRAPGLPPDIAWVLASKQIQEPVPETPFPLFLRPAFRFVILFFDALRFDDELYGLNPLVLGRDKGDGVKVRVIVSVDHLINFRLHLIRQTPCRPGQLRGTMVQFMHPRLKLLGSILQFCDAAVQTPVGFRQSSDTAGIVDQP